MVSEPNPGMRLRPDELASLRIDRERHADDGGGGPGFFGWLLRIIVIGGIAVGGYAAGQGKVPQLEKFTQLTQTAPEVQLVAVVKEDPGASIPGRLTASGYIISRTKSSLSFKLPGRIAALYAREGDRVRGGQELARQEDTEQKANVMRARAALETARAGLGELEAGSRTQEIQRAEWVLKEAQANAKHAAQTLSRYQSLLAKGGIARQQVDQARMTRDMSAAQVQNATQALSMMREGPRKEQIATARARVSEAEAALRVAQELLDQTVLKAPYDGVLIDRGSEVGDTVLFSGDSRQPTGMMVFTLADLKNLEAEVDISETNLGQVHEGALAEVSVDAFPDKKYAGVVRMIMPRANRQKAIVPVKVRLTETDAVLRPDMSAKVSFLPKGEAVRKGPPRVMVPQRAVQKRDGRTVVFTVQGGVARALPVEIGPAEGDRVPVTSGLAGGEDIIVDGLAEVADGVKVRVKKPEQHS
jgi:HlyD family secretion protein